MTEDETRAYQREWKRRDRLANPEKYREADRLKYEKQRERRLEYAREYRAANPDKVLACNRRSYANSPTQRAATRERNLRAKYGVSNEQARELLASQQCVCAICCRPVALESAPGERPTGAVDHDHATGKVRGVLCDYCNRGLGLFEDSPTSLRMAADYLEEARYGTRGLWPEKKGGVT